MTTVLPGFLDAHVHLALIDSGRLSAGGIGRVLDLGGWAPTAGSGSGTVTAAPSPETRYAGQFLGAPGGYPSRASWAPAGSFCPVGSPADAAAQLLTTVANLAQLRYQSRGPAYIKLGRSVAYLQSDLDTYIMLNRTVPSRG